MTSTSPARRMSRTQRAERFNSARSLRLDRVIVQLEDTRSATVRRALLDQKRRIERHIPAFHAGKGGAR